MYFKQLDIVGFKSFPDKTKIKFEPGVTAVVGPNGCGKSNIADAIRWVLGEQSPKSLRGSAMEDIIFNGTDSVEPTNMAEVSLTLSNQTRTLPIDYDEVTITRRLFRSGESEYILNKTPVRLKDITHLLMGTGMGTSSYSIIEQGKIDRILSSRPEERRHIFEEASGITRYKSKRKEALRKLEHTENNLVRINDIITEVKRQINSIERHAKKAEKYKKDFEVMKNMDLKLATYELKSINSNLGKNRESLEELIQKETSLKSELNEALELIGKYRIGLEDAINELTQTQKDLSETTLFVDKGKHTAMLNKERIGDLESLKTTVEGELSSIKEKIGYQEEEITTIRNKLKELTDSKLEKEKTFSEKEESAKRLSHEIDEHQKDIKVSKNMTLDLVAFQTKTKNELIKLGADLQNRKSRVRRLQTEKENIEEERSGIEERLRKADNELSLSQDKVRIRNDAREEFKNSLIKSEEEFEEKRKEIIENEKKLNSLHSKEEILKEMIKNFEGFDKGVKLIMESAKNGILSGVSGIVAEMLEPESGYEQALETALDKKAEAILVENKEALDNSISYIKGKGTSCFIVHEEVKNIRGYNRSYPYMRREGLSPLGSFVKTDPSLKALADYLLDDIYFVEDLQKARNIAARYKGGFKLVTRDGFLVEKAYIFGGGTKSNNTTSIIGRTKRLEQILSDITLLTKDIESLKSSQIFEKDKINQLKQEVAKKENELKKEEIELANAFSKKETIETSLKKLDDELSVVGLEISEVGELIHEISFKGEDLNKTLNEKEIEYTKNQDLIVSSQEAIQAKTKQKTDFLFEISEMKSEINFIKNTEESEEKNLSKEEKLYEEHKTQHEEKESTMKNSSERITLLLEETKTLEEEIIVKEIDKDELKLKLEKVTENKNALSEELREKEKLSRKEEEVIDDLRNRIRNFEIQNREKELKTVNIRDRVQQAYKINIEEVDVAIEESTDWEETKNQVEVLKIKLEKLGPVNLVAIDEHKELEERYSFLTQQQDDLLAAKESLHKAIQKINKTTKALFVDAFQKIQVEFKDYFRMLFGGGHAELLLVDETDVLESGIEIVARPPGKKLQNLLLLSGGEKALTAIALLFAIFKVKPSPFCILDEVDAPLDESNIGKFTRMLNDFLKTSQFIVITHSKRTMQMANVLYGITMQKKGISKLVSVRFTEGKEEPPSKKKEVLV